MSNTLSHRFGQRVRQLRESRKWSQTHLADVAGLHRTHISLIENASREVQLDTVEKLSVAFGISPAELFREPTDFAQTGPQKLTALLPAIREFQKLASEYDIDDIFQDNGGKLLQTLILLSLKKLPKREGNDAVDANGKEYELKTVNIKLTKSFSTHHHLNENIIEKYRKVEAWFFSIYEHIELRTIYRVESKKLEPLFAQWETKCRKEGKELNNPKIPVEFVKTHGTIVYPLEADSA